MLFRGDAEAQILKRGLVTKEYEQENSYLGHAFEYGLACVALQNFEAYIGLIFRVLILRWAVQDSYLSTGLSEEGRSCQYKLKCLSVTARSAVEFSWLFVLVLIWYSTSANYRLYYKAARTSVCRMNYITVKKMMSLSPPPDSRSIFYVLTAYDAVWSLTLRAAPSPTSCCISTDNLMHWLGFYNLCEVRGHTSHWVGR